MATYPFRYHGVASRLGAWVLIIPALLLKLCFHVGPSLVTAVLSLTDATTILFRPVSFVGFDNYRTIFGAGMLAELWLAARNTFVYTAVVVVFQNLLGLLLAFVLNRRFPGRDFLRAFFYLPVILGVVVCGMLWRLMFYPFGGLFTVVLKALFGIQSIYFDDPSLGVVLAGFVHTWMYVGFSGLVFLAGFQTIPGELYEAATMDGASTLQSFRYVTLPFLAQAVTINVLVSTTGTMRSFDLLLILTGFKPHAMTLAYLVYHTAFGVGPYGGQQGLASAQQMVLFALVLAVAIVQQFYLRRREVTV
jgi:raffinose/stachyose/melibiose transport system permease protein